GPGSSPGGITPAVLARTKLQQARLLMNKANYDAADALAHEVELLRVTYSSGEDTPQKVREDISRARSDPKALVGSAREALQAGDLDRAEALAHAAEGAGSWNLPRLWGDSPAKVLRDVQAARGRTGMTLTSRSAKNSDSQVVSPSEA